MKISSRFFLLSVSIILIPLLITIALSVAQWLTDGWTRNIGRYSTARRRLDRYIVERPASADEIVEARPHGVEIAVVGANDVVRSTSIAGLAEGERLSFPQFFDELDVAGKSTEIVVLGLDGEDARGRYLVAQFSRPRIFQSRPPWLPALVGPFLILTPGIAISLWILRDLRRSIVTLRDAAVRIGSGDLDFEIEQRSRDEFSEVHRAFEQMRRTIREEYDRRARFTMGVSHDLKTPLAIIKGYAEAIEDGLADDPETLERYVRIIGERSDLLQERISHLIEFLKLDTGEWSSTLQPVDMAGFLEECAAAASVDARLAERSVETDVDLPEGMVVRLDPVLVRRALENLTANAIQYGSPDSAVTIRASADETATKIVVANSGRTISATQFSLYTEPLYRQESSRQTPGFGLGLSIVKSVVESHGWSISIDDSAPNETRIVIEIPRDPDGSGSQ